MPTVWPIGKFLDNLKDNLETRIINDATFRDVVVFTAPPTPEEMPDDLEAIVLGVGIETDEQPVTLGDAPMRSEEINLIECFVSAYDLQDADGESSAVLARDRALGILGITETELRADPYQGFQGSVRSLHISGKSMDQGVEPDLGGRVCVIEFEITFIVRTDVP